MSVAQKTVAYISDQAHAGDATLLSREMLQEHISAVCYEGMQSVESASSSYLVDFSVQPPPPPVFGYDAIVDAMLRKSLGSRPLQHAGSEAAKEGEAARLNRLLGLRTCKGDIAMDASTQCSEQTA
jgi:hypothetical protein